VIHFESPISQLWHHHHCYKLVLSFLDSSSPLLEPSKLLDCFVYDFFIVQVAEF